MKPLYLYISPFFPTPESWRGGYALDFVHALRDTGRYDVRVLVPGRGPDYTLDGIPVIRFREWRLPSMVLPFLFVRRNAAALLRTLRDHAIDPAAIAVCHANTPFVAPYALALRARNPHVRAILHHHFLDSFGLALGRLLRRSWLHRRLHYPLLLRLHAALDGHVFVSEAARRAFLAVPDATWIDWPDYHRQMRGLRHLPSPRIAASTILHNGIDPARFRPAPRPPHTGFAIGCVMNLTRTKDPLTLLRALALISDKLGDWRLHLLGTGPLEGACRRFIAAHRLSEHVIWEPERDHAELPAFYRTLDLLILPTRFDSFGCVCAEAHACGTPFITTTAAGIAECLPPADRDRWLAPPHDPAALADRILAYHTTRPTQTLTTPLTFPTTLPPFLTWLDTLRKVRP